MATKTGIQIEGISKVVRSLEKMGVEVADLKSAFTKVGNEVADTAKDKVHSQSGSLAASIRASKSKNKAIVRAGSAKVPYAGVQEYGGYNNITPQKFLEDALDERQDDAIRLIDKEIASLIRKLDLKD